MMAALIDEIQPMRGMRPTLNPATKVIPLSGSVLVPLGARGAALNMPAIDLDSADPVLEPKRGWVLADSGLIPVWRPARLC